MAREGMAPAAADTFPRLLLWHARVRPEHAALREKDLGVWQTWSWSDLAAEVRALPGRPSTEGLLQPVGAHFIPAPYAEELLA